MNALPTRKLEAYRYADVSALATVWSELAQPERITVAQHDNVQQIWLPGTGEVQLRRLEIFIEAGATARIFALNKAATYGRFELDVTLADGAHFSLDAANIGAGKSTLEIVTTVRHIGVASTSRQTVRSVLGGTAVGTYMGKVAVARSGQQTDSVQSVKAMLLDRGATANAKPELEIYADDVKCAHGATVGELDPQQLFYAAARGLDPASARALLLEGFVAGLWGEIEGDDQGISELARAALWRVA